MLSYVTLTFVFASLVGALVGPSSNANNFDELESSIKSLGLTSVPTKQCRKFEINDDGITYDFYTRERILRNMRIEDIHEEIFPAYHHVNKTTKILVHGWMQSSKIEDFQKMIYDYLYTQDVNVITMDWSVYAKVCNLEVISTDVTTVAAESLARVMKFLLARGTKATKFHIVGFGVGAHIAGIAGKKMHPHMIGRITALDPLGLYFDYAGISKLQTGDAHLVDVIYTSSGSHGSKRDMGHVIFYPEGGRHPQPGCGSDDMVCSVLKSIRYFRRSILTPEAYPAKIIDDFSDMKEEQEQEGSLYTADNYMGEYVQPSEHGKYYVNVKSLSQSHKNFISGVETSF